MAKCLKAPWIWRVWSTKSHSFGFRCRKVLHSPEPCDWFKSEPPSKPELTKPKQWKDFFWNYWERCSLFYVLFKLIRYDSGAFGSLRSQGRGSQSLKIERQTPENAYLNTWSNCAWSKCNYTFQVHRPKKKSLSTFFLLHLRPKSYHPSKFQQHWLLPFWVVFYYMQQRYS